MLSLGDVFSVVLSDVLDHRGLAWVPCTRHLTIALVILHASTSKSHGGVIFVYISSEHHIVPGFCVHGLVLGVEQQTALM